VCKLNVFVLASYEGEIVEGLPSEFIAKFLNPNVGEFFWCSSAHTHTHSRHQALEPGRALS
jgi:hypothetical protein